jgi:hypothetical protein
MDIPNRIANLLNESDPDIIKRLDTPSQVFSQAVMSIPHYNELSMNDTAKAIMDYAREAGIDPLLVNETLEYAQKLWGKYASKRSPEYEEHDKFDDEDMSLDMGDGPGPNPTDPDSYSSRGY